MKRRWYFLDIAVILVSLIFKVPLLLVIGLLGLLILLMIDIWARYCLHDLNFQRSLSEQHALFGEEITLSISIENAKILPLPWLEIEDCLPRMLNVKERKSRIDPSSGRNLMENLFSPRWYERVTKRYTIVCNTRGIHTFGPTVMRSGDLFGFTERQNTLDNRQYLTVYPLVVPLSSFHLPARYPFGDRRAPRRLLEDPSRVVGIRDYSYGDDLRRVHWKATARTMELQSKVYEATISYTLVLFLNTAMQFDYHFGFQPELQELAICATASVADWALNQGYSVGLYVNSIAYVPERGMRIPATQERDETRQEASPEAILSEQIKLKRIRISPNSSEDQRRRIMSTLARIQGHFGDTIEELLRTERSHLPAGATVVVVTSKISDPLLDALNHLRRVGHAVTILLVGDQPAMSHLAGITVYPLGGETTWKQLNPYYTLSAETDTPEQRPEPDQMATFHL